MTDFNGPIKIMGISKCKIWNESIAAQSLPDLRIRIRSHKHKMAAIE
jgi:hypothetical protein